MQKSVSRFPGLFQKTENQNAPVEKVKVSEADQLSPVALTTRAANRLSLPPLQWTHYDSMPAMVYAKNTGFTVMIQATFHEETPHLSSGPLSERYNFSQIHFHWGEHDETGSGHSVDGVRYPLEMHVVHVKKDCASLSEASGTKDGIAITVHLFTLREERNTSLDQLMAVLQFIQKPNCCAKLYPSSLAEVVHPFNNDYFLYWGAVPGSSQQHYRIVWLVSRQVLPVSSHQLEQFRELRDDKGNFIWSNSNDPHPLGDRSLFLVSPSDKVDESMSGISRRPTRSVMTLESDKSIELHNAEFKSLVGLQEADKGSCAICPHPNHAGYKATKPSEDPVKIKEGDSSVEESCVDLGTLQEPGFVLKTDLNTTKDDHKEKTTDVNITDCGNSCKAKYIPSQDMYSVISANEEEIHLKRKPLLVRKSDPSTEQACVFLTRPPSVHSARSAPSLTTWGHLGVRKECTELPDLRKNNKSSEVIIFNKSLEFSEAKKHGEVSKKILFSDELETAKIGSISRNVKDAATQRSGNVQTFGVKENLNIIISQAKLQSPAVPSQSPDKEETVTELTKENAFHKGELFDDELKTEYLLVKQAEPKKSFYKVIGEFLLTPDSKRTFVKRGHSTNEALLSEISDKDKHQLANGGSSKNKNVVYKKVVLSFPPSLQETSKHRVVENSNNVPPKIINENTSKDRSAINPHSKVNVEVQKSITDQKNIGENNDEVSKKYYVTKITPVIKSQQENSVGSTENKLYYAQPIVMKEDVTTDKVCQAKKNKNNTKSEHSATQQYTDNTKKHHIETQYIEDVVKEHNQNFNLATNILVGDDFINIKTTNSIENIKPSDHLLMRKQVRVVAPYENTETAELKSSPENKISVKNYIDSVSPSHKNLQTLSTNLKDPLDPEISVKILQTEKSQTIYQIKENNSRPNQKNDYNMEFASNKQTELGNMNKNQSNNSNHKTKIKLAISIKSHGERSKSNELQTLENLTLDTKESTVNKAKPLFPTREIEKPVSGTHVKDVRNLNVTNSHMSNNDEVVLEEELEENTVYSSQKSKKKTTIKVTNPTYKLPIQVSPAVTNQLSSQHLVTINKVEVPDPYYLTRVPRQPLIEYKAFQTGHDQQVETVQTEETTVEVKTTKTSTSIKKGKKTSKNDPSMSIELEPTRSKNTEEINYSKTKTTDSSINNQLFKQQKENPPINASNENTKQNHSNYEKTIKMENVHENVQKVTIDCYQSRNSLLDKSLHSQHDDNKNEVKNTRIVIGSHQPKKAVTNKETKLINETISNDENNKSKTLEILIQQNQSQKYLSDHQDQYTNLQNNVRSSVHCPESENKNLIGESVIANDQSPSTQNHENVTINQIYKSRKKYIDAATSNPSEYFRFTSQYLQNQQSQAVSYTDIEEEPTKDPGFDTFAEEGSPHSLSNPEIASIMDQSTEMEKLTSTKPNIKNGKSTSNADKDIVYIHRRDPVTTSNLDSKWAKETEIKQGKSEKLIKNSQKPSELRKTISENIYQPPKSEELISTHDYDGEENETNSSHCNVTFKNETKIELPSGQMAHMKSLGQVKFNPIRKSGKQNIPRPEASSPAKLTTNQATMTTMDKCCSAIELREKIFNPNNGISADTSTSVDEGLNENEYTPANYSPVKIKTDQTVVKICPPLKFIGHWNRTTNEDALLENNGKTVRATLLENAAELPILRGGVLESDYVFAELHFHWGRKDCCGAEHIIDDQRHSMEAHFLYFKKDYGSVKEALTHEDGLAMVAIQFNVGGPPHPLFGQLIKDIALIREAATGVYVPAESLFSWVKQTVEEARGYFSYKGTMISEPPYVEAVTWLVFQKPMLFCCQQSVEFRKLMSSNGELLLKTNRAPRPLNNRTIIYVPL